MTASISVQDATHLWVVVPDGLPGPSTLKLTTPAGSGSATTAFTPTLAITGISPSTGPPGQLITVHGMGFYNSASPSVYPDVYWRGIKLARHAVYSNGTAVTATIPASAASGASGTVTVTVGGQSVQSPTTFTVQ
jgi:hypothetical protein